MKVKILSQLLRDDEQRIEPNMGLQHNLASKMDRPHLTPIRLWRSATLIGATAVIAIAFVSFNKIDSKGSTSFIAQANAAYKSLQTKLSEPGAVRHRIVQFANLGNPEYSTPANINDPIESWSTADGSSILSGPKGSPNTLYTQGKSFISQDLYDQYFSEEEMGAGSGGDIATNSDGSYTSTTYNSEGTGPQYSVTTPPDTAAWSEKYDPNNPEIHCVNITPFTEAQKAARDTRDALDSASDFVSNGTAGPEVILSIVERSSAVEDKGMQHDEFVGYIHVYRIAYDSVLGSIDPSEIGKKEFQEFGFSPETYLMRVIRSGYINVSGKEVTENSMMILLDEVMPANQISENFFSPTQRGFIATPPADMNNPDSLPSFILHNGCYAQGTTEPKWLGLTEEAAARERIAALGDHAGMNGGGGL